MNDEATVAEFLAYLESQLRSDMYGHLGCLYTEYEGAFTVLHARLVLAPRERLTGPYGTRLVDYRGLFGFRVAIPHDHVLGAIRSIVDGTIPAVEFGGGSTPAIGMAGENGRPMKFNRSYQYDPGGWQDPGTGFGGLYVEASDSFSENVFDRSRWSTIDRTLASQDPPFAGLEHLARSLWINWKNYNSSREVEIFAPTWTRLRDVYPRITDAKIDVEVETYRKTGLDAISVSLIPEHLRASHDGVLTQLSSDRWEHYEDDGIDIYRTTFDVDPGLGPLHLCLSIDGTRIERKVTGLGASRVGVHELVDPDDSQLLVRRLGINSDKLPESNRFETGVAWLLHLCGFNAIHYGYSDLRWDVDVVAFLGEHQVVLAECTVTLPDPKKAQKLATEAERVRSAVLAAGWNAQIVRAIFIPLQRSALDEKQRQTLYEDSHCVVVCQDDMLEMFELAKRGANAREVFYKLATTGYAGATHF